MSSSLSSFTEQEVSEITFQLQYIPMFSDLKDKARNAIKSAVQLCDLEEGQQLMVHNQSTKPAMYLILSGHLWLEYPGEARVMMVSGCILGQELFQAAKAVDEAVDHVPAPFTVTAKTKLRCAKIPWQACQAAKPNLVILGESVDPIMRRRVRSKMVSSSSSPPPEQPKKLVAEVTPLTRKPARSKAPNSLSDDESSVSSHSSSSSSSSHGGENRATAPTTSREHKKANAATAAAAAAATTSASVHRRQQSVRGHGRRGAHHSRGAAAAAAASSSSSRRQQSTPAQTMGSTVPTTTTTTTATATATATTTTSTRIIPNRSRSRRREASSRTYMPSTIGSAAPVAAPEKAPAITPAATATTENPSLPLDQREKESLTHGENKALAASSSDSFPNVSVSAGPLKSAEPRDTTPTTDIQPTESSLSEREPQESSKSQHSGVSTSSTLAVSNESTMVESKTATPVTHDRRGQREASYSATQAVRDIVSKLKLHGGDVAESESKKTDKSQSLPTLSTEKEQPILPSQAETSLSPAPGTVNTVESSPGTSSVANNANTEHPVIAAKRRAMEEAAKAGDYMTAGRLQGEVQKLLDIFRAMEGAAKKEDYVMAGRYQAELLELGAKVEMATFCKTNPIDDSDATEMGTSAVPVNGLAKDKQLATSVHQVDSEGVVGSLGGKSCGNVSEETDPETTALCDKGGSEPTKTANEEAATPSTISLESSRTAGDDTRSTKIQPVTSAENMEMNRAVDKVRSKRNKFNSSDDSLLGTSTSSGEWNKTREEKRSKTRSKDKDLSDDSSHQRKSSSHKKHRRNRSSIADPKSDNDSQRPPSNHEGKERQRRHQGKSVYEIEPFDGFHSKQRQLNANDNKSARDVQKSHDSTLNTKRSSKHKSSSKKSKDSKSSQKQREVGAEGQKRRDRKSTGKEKDPKERAPKELAPEENEMKTGNESEGSFDFIGESNAENASDDYHTDNISIASSIELGEDSKNRFVASKTFFEKASTSSQNLFAVGSSEEAQSQKNHSRSSLQGSRGTLHDSLGKHGMGDSKNGSHLGLSGSLFPRHNSTCEDDGSEGSLDLFNEAERPGPQNIDLLERGKERNNTGRKSQSERPEETSETSLDFLGTATQKNGANVSTDGETFLEQSPDLVGGSQSSKQNDTPDESSDQSFDLIGGIASQNEDANNSSGKTQQSNDSSNHSLNLTGVTSPKKDISMDSSDQSLDLLGGPLSPSQRPEIGRSMESSDHSLDIMRATSTKDKGQPDDCSVNSLDQLGQDRKGKFVEKTVPGKSRGSSIADTNSKNHRAKDPTKAPPGSILKKDKNGTKDKPAKKRVRFDFVGRFKETDPDRLPRPPMNVRQVSLDISADFMPREYKKSEEEKLQITQALSNVFAFESMSAENLKKLINAFEPEEAEAGVEIVSPDSEECDFYVVADGEVSVARDGEEIDILKSGETFGEENLFHRPARRVSISALRKTQLFRVDQATYRSVLQVETRTVEKRKRELIDNLLLFDSMSDEMRKKVAEIMKPALFAKGATISSGKGENRRLYLIDKGIARSTDETKRTYAGGDTLGEKGFRRGGNGLVEAVATTNVAAYYIDVPTYEKAIGPLSERIVPDIQSPKFKDMRPVVLGFDGMRFSKKKPLTIEESRALISLMEDVTYEKDEVILDSDVESPGRMFYLRRGSAESRTEPNSVSFIIPGILFGGAFFKSALASKTKTALSKSRIVATDRCLISVLHVEDFLSTRDKYLKKLNHVAYQSDSSESDSDSNSDSSSSSLSDEGSIRVNGQVYKLENLVKRTILGEGGFGQVWLVSDKTEGEQKPYAFKIQSKHALIQAHHAEAVIREKKIMASISHPFVVKLLASFQDENFVYFLLNMMQGGELYTLMHPVDEDLSSNGMQEDHVKFYAFGIADALAYLHEKRIVFRDLKPENVLIDSLGYPVLVDFGLAKVLKDGEKTFTLLGTPGYLAPEVCLNIGHSFGVDHWALGILIYEMLSGEGPFFFFGIDQVELYRSIVQDPHEVPENAGPDAVHLVDFLLTKDPNGRLGNLSGGEADIMKHVWFKGMDGRAMRKRKVVAPWLPDISDPFDTSNFEDWSELEDRTKEDCPELSPNQAAVFEAL